MTSSRLVPINVLIIHPIMLLPKDQTLLIVLESLINDLCGSDDMQID